ncbi:MAG: hypothetical protein ACKOEC_08350 [Acidimicrobiia bacterium]
MFALILGNCLFCGTAASQDSSKGAASSVDNGTDPTKFSRIVDAKYEYLELNAGISSGTLRLSYFQPLGDKRDYNLRLRVPVTRVNALGNDDHGLGDVSAQISRVLGLTRTHGFVAQGEVSLDTARRPELGAGKNVFKGTLVYALFLPGGAIFAPAVVQSNSFSGKSSRATINSSTFDFYYVPKFRDPRNLMTLDPALNIDWENDTRFVSLAVTIGRAIGPAMGGNGVLSVKPSLFAGDDKPGKWGIEAGYKIIGF